MAPKSGVKWDAAADAQLFKCVLEVHEVKPNYGSLAEKMNDAGYDCTPKALMHRIAHLRNTTTTTLPSKTIINNKKEKTSSTTAAPTTTTTAKTPPSNKNKNKSAGIKRTRNEEDSFDDDEIKAKDVKNEKLQGGKDYDDEGKQAGGKAGTSVKGKKIKVERVDDEEV
ncbi:MAG: hypothetical protein Q9216_005870 [Gyalolechia sp. 2 TL-2023]